MVLIFLSKNVPHWKHKGIVVNLGSGLDILLMKEYLCFTPCFMWQNNKCCD